MADLNQLLQNHFAKQRNIAYTENGATARATTGSAVLDFFSQAGAYRTGAGAEAFIENWTDAFKENPQLAVRCLFYIRDVRGGQGERDTFRTFFKDLAVNYPKEVAATIVKHIPVYGRWDDLLDLLDTPIKGSVIQLIKDQLDQDLATESPSLMAKWLPSENASSNVSKNQARVIRNALGLTSKDYRKVLSSLRKKIDVIECKMSSNNWGGIEYSRVPSQANLLYTKAFAKHDGERFTEFQTAVANGEASINASTQFPYEITRKVKTSDDDAALRTQCDLMWNNQPNYFGDNSDNSICVVDVSDSMSGLPMEIAVSLGIYVAERNKGAWHNKFITFESEPHMLSVAGRDIYEKVINMENAPWGGSTNIEAVFDLILKTAVNNNVSQDDFVKRMFLVSDMEFDDASGNNDCYGAQVDDWRDTLFETIADKYKKAGYKLPQLVFWNVRAAQSQFPMSIEDHKSGLQFMNVSGASPSIFKNIMENKVCDAHAMMLEVINGERYSQIVL